MIVFYPRIADVLCLSRFITPSLTHSERRTLYPFLGRSIVRDVVTNPQGRYRLALALDVDRQAFAYLKNLAKTALEEEKEAVAVKRRNREENVLAVNGRQPSAKLFHIRRQVQSRITAYNARKSATNPLSFEQNWRKFVGPAHYKGALHTEPQDEKLIESLGRNISWWEATLNEKPIPSSLLDFEMPEAPGPKNISFYLFLRKYPSGLPDAAPRKEVKRFIDECLLSRPIPLCPSPRKDVDSQTSTHADVVLFNNGSALISRDFGSKSTTLKSVHHLEQQEGLTGSQQEEVLTEMLETTRPPTVVERGRVLNIVAEK